MASRPSPKTPPRDAVRKRRDVFIVDDSAVARLIVQRVIDDTDHFRVVGHAASAEEALETLSTVSADIVILDIEMPGMDGIEAIPHIIRVSGNAPILIVSSHCRENAESSIRAMAMGASDVVLKPDSPALNAQFTELLKEKMRRLTEGGAANNPIAAPSRDAVAEPPAASTRARQPIDCLAIGASTGGIHGLSTFFAALPNDLGMPILITQHLPADFIVYFAQQLQVISGREAIPARDGQRVRGGQVLIAPGNAHLTVKRAGGDARIALDRTAMPNGICPSVDAMLSSVAETYGAGGVGIVLTGMGRDGAIGARALADVGGEVMAQDRETSVIWGMPGSVARQGIASHIASPADLAAHVVQRARAFGWK